MSPRDPARSDRTLAALRKLWLQVPEWRLGQIIVNATDLSEKCPELYLMSDEQLEKLIMSLSSGLRRRYTVSPEPPATT
jgi:hypothetical protein